MLRKRDALVELEFLPKPQTHQPPCSVTCRWMHAAIELKCAAILVASSASLHSSQTNESSKL